MLQYSIQDTWGTWNGLLELLDLMDLNMQKYRVLLCGDSVVGSGWQWGGSVLQTSSCILSSGGLVCLYSQQSWTAVHVQHLTTEGSSSCTSGDGITYGDKMHYNRYESAKWDTGCRGGRLTRPESHVGLTQVALWDTSHIVLVRLFKSFNIMSKIK